jgi:hypothetical protein
VEDAAIAVRFLSSLPRFLRTPLTLSEARAILRDRFERRAAAFLELARRSVFGRPASPYGRLLASAGCEAGDLEGLVAADGVEGALRSLYSAGVYLTVDELKGRRPVVRGSERFEVHPRALVNPHSAVHGLAQSGGSRGRPSVVPIDLSFIRDHAVNTHLTLDAHGGYRWSHAHWGVPGGTALTNTLELAKGGNPPERWFSPVAVSAPGIHPRYRLGARALWLASRASGVALPYPEHVPLADPLPIARWMADVLARGRTPHLWTFSSSAVLVARAALAAGIDLTGARFTAGGEPTTEARAAAIRRSGADVLPRFGATETDIFAFACRAPAAADDMHLLDDRHAVIQPGELGASHLPPKALLISSLLLTAPIVLLNVSLGDQAELAERRCGCPLDELGWSRHIWHARSYEKLTAGGVTLLDTDVIDVLEEVLPSLFGGSPTDYQVVEETGEDGRPIVRLVVHPAVGAVESRAVAEAFLNAIGGGSEGERMMELGWRGGGVFGVERRPPTPTASGKILHLHVEDP